MRRPAWSCLAECSLARLKLPYPSLRITGHGAVGFDHAISFNVRMSLLRQMFHAVPVLGWLAGVVDSAINTVLVTVTVEGTVSDPRVRVSQPILDTLIPG